MATTLPIYSNNDVRMEKVENGYLIYIKGDIYVFSKLKDALKFIQDYYEQEKK